MGSNKWWGWELGDLWEGPYLLNGHLEKGAENGPQRWVLAHIWGEKRGGGPGGGLGPPQGVSLCPNRGRPPPPNKNGAASVKRGAPPTKYPFNTRGKEAGV